MASPVIDALSRRLIACYEPDFRRLMTIAPEAVDDPVALAAAADTLGDDEHNLLDLALLSGPIGVKLAERLRPAIERQGGALWRAALLLPFTTQSSGGSLHPLHYAGACRLNPALTSLAPRLLTDPAVLDVPSAATTASFPPSDARWDAVILAAALEGEPAPLTREGLLRKDLERRLATNLGGDLGRWALAMRVGRAQGVMRTMGGKLHGLPETPARPLHDPSVLSDNPLVNVLAGQMLRLLGSAWVSIPGLLDTLRRRCRELVHSPRAGAYPDGRAFDTAGWDAVEAPLILEALDLLHRAGFIDAYRDGGGIRSARRAGPAPRLGDGFLLTPDGDILIHCGGLSGPDYGRLARMAPFLDGERVCRHRLTREGVRADLAAGHVDTTGFLAGHSRTGVPPSVADTLREWQRSATRLTLLTGVDIEEDEDGRLRIVSGPVHAPHRTIDYAQPPLARFFFEPGRILIPLTWDPLSLRATIARIARPAGLEGDCRVYVPERRPHRDPGEILDRLRACFGGELPGELEALVLAGGGLPPVRAEAALLVTVPLAAVGALRRDPITGPLLARWVAPGEAIVTAIDLPRLRRRLDELGLAWEGDPLTPAG